LRVWDLEPEKLCRQHLLGQHNEIHGLWTVLSEGRTGYAHHPETLRWKGKLPALLARHDATAEEMTRRGYRHNSPLTAESITEDGNQTEFVDAIEFQVELLRAKGCACSLA